VCSSEPYNVPTWLLDVAQALAQHSSASSRVCRDAARRAASEFFRTRGRAIDELGVTRPSCSRSLCASQHSSANCRPRKHIPLEKH
jgi:DNA-directed RNA polymerase subunit N (RpoN/RPB10)